MTLTLLLALAGRPEVIIADGLAQENAPTPDAPVTALGESPDIAEESVQASATIESVTSAAVNSTESKPSETTGDAHSDRSESDSTNAAVELPFEHAPVEGDNAAIDVIDAWESLEPSYHEATPLPHRGKAMYYNPGVMEIVIESRIQFGHISVCERCVGTVAMLRAGDLDRRVWLQTGPWKVEGPFHVVDAAAIKHVGLLLDKEWVIDVDYVTAQRWNMRMPIVTIWESPPLDLLLATSTIPLSWDANLLPSPSFEWSPQSYLIGSETAHAVAGYQVKRLTDVRYKGARPFVDLVTAIPNEYYVK